MGWVQNASVGQNVLAGCGDSAGLLPMPGSARWAPPCMERAACCPCWPTAELGAADHKAWDTRGLSRRRPGVGRGRGATDTCRSHCWAAGPAPASHQQGRCCLLRQVSVARGAGEVRQPGQAGRVGRCRCPGGALGLEPKGEGLREPGSASGAGWVRAQSLPRPPASAAAGASPPGRRPARRRTAVGFRPNGHFAVSLQWILPSLAEGGVRGLFMSPGVQRRRRSLTPWQDLGGRHGAGKAAPRWVGAARPEALRGWARLARGPLFLSRGPHRRTRVHEALPPTVHRRPEAAGRGSWAGALCPSARWAPGIHPSPVTSVPHTGRYSV